MEAKITSSNCIVISSGLVASFDGAPIDIALPKENGTSYHVIFEFIHDESTKEYNLSAISLENGMKFLLTNFPDPLGRGTIKPINFAKETEINKNLYINFYVYSVGDANPILQYTIYREV